LATGLVVLLLVAIIIIYGYFHALNYKISNIKLDIQKDAGDIDKLKIVLLSDIHLATTFSKSRLNSIVKVINGMNPDLVLFAGDVVEDINSTRYHDLGIELKRLTSTYGCFAITGNHEYYDNINETCLFLKENNIKILRDEIHTIGKECLYIVGREDITKSHHTLGERKSLDELIENLDKSKPIIMMDH
jgi:predicted MPP superfamily phosphohydrolase